MRGLVIPLFYAPAATTVQGDAWASPLRVWVQALRREAAFPVMDWISLDVEQGRWDTQSKATLTVRASDYWLTQTALGIDALDYGALISLDVYWQDMTTPIFSGPTQLVEMREDRNGRTVTFTFEHWTRHFLSRRLMLNTTAAKNDLAGGAADTVLANLLRFHGFNSGTTITPAGYPASRTDWDAWAVTTPAAAGTHATTVNADVSDGRRLLEEAEHLMDAHDMSLTWAETSAATFTLTVAPAYQANDYTNEISLDLRRGSLTDYTETVDYSGLENVLMMKISGGTRAFTQDSTSVAYYGVYEGAYAGQEYDSNAASDEGTYLKGRFANPSIAFDGAIVDQPGATFMVDYARRDLVTIASGGWGRSADKLVIGSKISASGRNISAAVVLGDPPAGYDAAAREGDGTVLGRGRGLGSRYKVPTP